MDLSVKGQRIHLSPFKAAIQRVKKQSQPKNDITRWTEQEWTTEIYQEYMAWTKSEPPPSGKKLKNVNSTILSVYGNQNGVKIVEPLNVVEKEKIRERLNVYIASKQN